MSVEQTQREINQLDTEIVTLEKKRADLEQKEADRTKKIIDLQRSITKNTSISTISSKNRQMQGYQNEISKFQKDKADITKKIADKRKTRTDKAVKLQKEETTERQKDNRTQQIIQRGYEQRIDELTSQIRTQAFILPPRTPLTHHLYSETNREEYDVFISHASEDKKGFADDLYKELDSLDVKVWYDTMSIQWGDSLRSKIDEGLKKSKFGIVILSNDYIRKGWTQYELDGLFQREMTGGKVILPIWHKITKDEVQAFSPTLAGRKALNTAMVSAKEIAKELVDLLKQDPNKEPTHEQT